MLTGNKGEWSELYAFLKILEERQITAADENLIKNPEIFYPVLKITRTEEGKDKNYEFLDKKKVKISVNESEISVADLEDLKSGVAEVLRMIKQNSDTTFSMSSVDGLMTKLNITRLNAGNGKKEDLVLKIHDKTTGIKPEIGFSIKSRLGGAATLLNASAATNFIYEVRGLDSGVIEGVNSINTRSKVRDRLAKIVELGGSFKYSDMQSETFKKNLRKTDTVLPEMVAELLLVYYYGLGSTMFELMTHLGDEKVKILDFDLDASDYEFKIKGLLHNVALGMVPNSLWDGVLRAQGGYIVVREDGEIVCYHVYNADQFRSYLFRNTKLETASTTRHDYGRLYEENGRIFIKLNLQIRFLD